MKVSCPHFLSKLYTVLQCVVNITTIAKESYDTLASAKGVIFAAVLCRMDETINLTISGIFCLAIAKIIVR